MAFDGFTTDRLVGLPPELFSEVLPQITLPSELKVTLHVFWRMSRLRGSAPRRLSWEDLLEDKLLRRSLRTVGKLRPAEHMLAEGLEAAVQRGTLLHLIVPDDGRSVNWYLVNTETNRRWVAHVGRAARALAAVPTVEPERPPLVLVYEQNIGLVTPLVLEELREAEEHYPPHWIEDAIREAVLANARSWRYIRKVLERWAASGRNDATGRAERPIDIEKYTSGEHGHLFRRGGDTNER